MSDFILAMDIGYSNWKLAMGHADQGCETAVYPAGAGPIESMPHSLTGTAGEHIQVLIGDKKWVVGVEPERLQGWERQLHSDYPESDLYKALFYASLVLSGKGKIDRLVTGLPVDQFKNAKRRSALEKLLIGKHQVTPKREVTVESVQILPQPAGGYMQAVEACKDEETLYAINHGRTVVIDPGFFSVDWVALREGEIRYDSSGTTLKAMSVLLQDMCSQIQDDHGISPGVEKLEKAIRASQEIILVRGQQVAINDYFDTAASRVAEQALNSMRQELRHDGMDADVVVLAGGGAKAYRNATEEIFPEARILVPDNPVAAIAEGFWYCGQVACA